MEIEDKNAREFIEEKSLSLSPNTIQNYTNCFKKLEKHLDKPFAQADKEDMIEVVKNLREEDLKESSVNSYLTNIKKFYKWLNDGECPEKVEWIDINYNTDSNAVELPEKILDQKDVRKMMKKTDRLHDRAMVMTLYESGARASEFLALNKDSVSFEQSMGHLTLPNKRHGLKTGQRRIPIVNSVPVLQDWLNNHPLEGDAPLWINFDHRSKHRHNRLTKAGLSGKLKRFAREAGIEKKVYPHLFRHSRATHLAAEGLNESQLCEIFGWVRNSDAPAVYIHLADKDVDKKFKQLHGIELSSDEKKDELLNPWVCDRCGHKNSSDNDFCGKCGLALSDDAVRRREADENIVEKLDVSMGTSKEELRSIIREILQEEKSS